MNILPFIAPLKHHFGLWLRKSGFVLENGLLYKNMFMILSTCLLLIADKFLTIV